MVHETARHRTRAAVRSLSLRGTVLSRLLVLMVLLMVQRWVLRAAELLLSGSSCAEIGRVLTAVEVEGVEVRLQQRCWNLRLLIPQGATAQIAVQNGRCSVLGQGWHSRDVKHHWAVL